MRYFSLVSFLIKNKIPCTQSSGATRTIAYFSTNNSSRHSDKDEDKSDKKKQSTKNEETLDKLNLLLKQMIDEEPGSSKTPKLDLAKPKKKRLMQKEPGEQEVKIQSTDEQMKQAVKDVASSLGDDTKKTESDLLMKLLSTSEESSKSSASLSDIVRGMQVDRSEDSPEKHSRAQEVRQLLQKMAPRDRRPSSDKTFLHRPRKQFREVPTEIEKIDLFGGARLGIFDKAEDANEENKNKTWNKLYARELKLAVTHPPSNYFQQMILWTEQNKIWKFPIDNEQEWEEEQDVCFTEHIFLEKHLDPWCPTKGPIRHFMELVCVGLSKNPYLSVEAKKEHIFWYRDYFEDKRKLLQEVGAISEGTKQ